MRYYWLSALSLLTAVTLANFATPLVPWDDIRTKHTWNTAPANWENLGHPAAGTTIDLYIALQPHLESALIDALYQVSDPTHPRHVFLTTPPLPPHYGSRCSVSDTAHTCLRNRSPSWSGRTQTRSSSSIPGLYITACDPPPSQ